MQVENQVKQSSRPISTIAQDITKHWPNAYYGAVPYIRAMYHLKTIRDRYIADDAESIILRFLINASSWRGSDARRIKAELKAILKEKK